MRELVRRPRILLCANGLRAGIRRHQPPNGAVRWRPLIRHADQRIGGLPCRDGTRVARWLGTARLPDYAVGSGGSSLIFRWYIESVYSYLIWCNPGCDPFWSNSTTLHTKPSTTWRQRPNGSGRSSFAPPSKRPCENASTPT